MPKKMGRPRHPIDKAEFEKLCLIQCTEHECAAWFGCELKTLHRWVKMTYGKTFGKVFQEKRGYGKVSLRRSMYQKAIDPKGPPAIAIFVAKNHLGMADKIETVNTNANTTESKLIIEYSQEGGDENGSNEES